MSTTLEIDRRELADFCERYHIRRMALFGSVVNGEFSESSDVDVAVEFETDAEIGLIKFNRIKRKLAEIFDREVDLHTFSEMSAEARKQIEEQSEDVYAV